MPSSTVLLAIIAGLLVILIILMAMILRRKPQVNNMELLIAANFGEAVDRLNRSVEHHVDISAVVEMVRQLDADPDALQLLKSYPETVRAAAMLHYINTLGADLQAAHKQLSGAHRNGQNVPYYQSRVDSIQRKLDAAVEAAGATGLRSV